jgi:hypothetical protein
VQIEPARRIAACAQQEERAAGRAVRFVGIQVHIAASDGGQHDEGRRELLRALLGGERALEADHPGGRHRR